MSIAVILAVGEDPTVLDTRSAVLRSAGYIVKPASSPKQAVDDFVAGDFDLVVLCHTIPLEDRRRLTQFIRGSGSAIPILYVGSLGEWFQSGGTEETGNRPDEILEAVKAALSQARSNAMLRYPAQRENLTRESTGKQAVGGNVR
jgi:DNA-binding response OmpR family regulator